MSNWVWLEPTGACTARLTAQHLLTWCKVLGVPDVFVSDTASHFKNHMMAELEKALGVERKFAVANSPQVASGTRYTRLWTLYNLSRI